MKIQNKMISNKPDTTNYKWNPELYSSHSNEQMVWAITAIKQLTLEGWESIADIGCGDGKITERIASTLTTGHVTGVDKSKDMVKFARKTFCENRPVLNLSFIEGSAEKLILPFPVDLIISFTTLHWVKDHIKMLQVLRQNLNPNGRILLEFAGRGNAADILKVADDVMNTDRWATWFHNFSFPWFFYDTKQYELWLKESGYSPLKVELVPKDMKHAGVKELNAWIRATWLPFVNRVPVEQRNDFVNDIVYKFYNKSGNSDLNSYIITKMVRLQILAKVASTT